MSDAKPTSSIAILGAGDVGATIAYSLIMNPVAGDILLVDPKEEVRDAQVILAPSLFPTCFYFRPVALHPVKLTQNLR
jgi:glycine/D-amino acid oxidase-like deaminating enzyme